MLMTSSKPRLDWLLKKNSLAFHKRSVLWVLESERASLGLYEDGEIMFERVSERKKERGREGGREKRINEPVGD